MERIDKKIDELTECISQSKKRKISEFKYQSNKVQFEFNIQIMAELEATANKSGKRTRRRPKETMKKLKTRNKHIKMADRSKAGWKIIQEYLTDEVASDKEDTKKIKRAEKAALQKLSEEKAKKKQAMPKSAERKPWNEKFRNAPRSRDRYKADDVCFRCGSKGHWGRDCRAYKNQEIAGRNIGWQTEAGNGSKQN